MADEADQRQALILDEDRQVYKFRNLSEREKETFTEGGKTFDIYPAKKFRYSERDWKRLGLSSTVKDFWIYVVDGDSEGNVEPLTRQELKDQMSYKKMSPFEMKQIVESDLERNLEKGLTTPTEKLANKKLFIFFAIVAIAVIVIYYSGVF